MPWFVFVPKGRCYLSCLTRTTWQANHAAPLSKWGLRVGAAWTQTEVLAKERAGEFFWGVRTPEAPAPTNQNRRMWYCLFWLLVVFDGACAPFWVRRQWPACGLATPSGALVPSPACPPSPCPPYARCISLYTTHLR